MRLGRIALVGSTLVVFGCSFGAAGLGGGDDFFDSGPPPSDSTVQEASFSDGRVDSTADAQDAIDLETADVADAEIEAETDAADACTTATGPNEACNAVGKLVGAQTVDGDDPEFACIPETVYSMTTAAVQFPTDAGAGLPEVVHVRVGWSSSGVGVFVHVEDPSVVVVPADHVGLFDADAVEVYLSGTSVLTGGYDGAAHDPWASQVVVAPPADGQPARARWYQFADKGALPAAYYASRLVSDGYVVELGLPWSFLRGAGASGVKIGFDLALDVDDDPTSPTTRQVWAAFVMKTVTGKSSCGGASPPYLWCDDRSWCTPTME